MRHAAIVLVAVFAGLSVGCAQRPGAASQSAGSNAARPSLEVAAGRLPAAVAGFTRGGTTWHERERAGLGVAVDYAGPARSAVSTVSVYDRGRASVPTDIASGVMQEEFSTAVGEALALAGTRTSQNIAERDRSELPVPGQASLQCARLQGTYGRQEVQTLLCLGSAAGRFLKVLVTSPARPVRPVDPMPFVVGIAQAARG